MSKKNYRFDKTCLNCRHVVEQKFCPNCGQENTDTRKTFHHLFLHFFEDLTHYENAFWRTMKNLLFRPASLTKEYLSGKRLSYLAPVRLYIFISFVTFFTIAIFPSQKDSFIKTEKGKTVIGGNGNNITIDKNDKKGKLKNQKSYADKYVDATDSLESIKTEQAILAKQRLREERIEELKKNGVITITEADSIKNLLKKVKEDDGFIDVGYHSIKQLDSVQKYAKDEEDKLNDFEYWFKKKIILVKQNNTLDQIIEKGKESAFHNFPKVLLIYMPLFAFFLWLFHNKKRWYYFDHGIFTLHYFSFLLLISLVSFLLSQFLNLFNKSTFIEVLQEIRKFIHVVWMFYYFFPAHHRFYGETRWVSFFKSISLFLINMFFITLLLLLFFVYTLININ